MDQPQKLPPRQVEALAQRLQTSLRRRRPRTWHVVVGVLAVVLVLLGLLVWWAYPPPDLPRLEVVAFDQAAAPGESPPVVAALAFPDEREAAPSQLRGLSLTFLDAGAVFAPGAGATQTVTTDAHGRAAVAWPRPPDGQVTQVAVRYVDARRRQGSADQANLFGWKRGRVLLVSVEDALAAVAPERWDTTHPANIAPRPGAGAALRAAHSRGYQIGYLPRVPARPLDYRKARGWVQAQQATQEAFPAGPMFAPPGDPAENEQALAALLQDVKRRFGEDLTVVVNHPAAVAAARAAELRVFSVAAAEPPAGATHVPEWAELNGRLNP